MITGLYITFQPLELATWPADQAPRYQRSQFKASYGATLELIKAELHRIGVEDAVIELDLTEREVRRDGLPRADARPRSPRVRLSFELEGVGPLQYPCASYDDYRANLRAIGLTLEAQRAMDRYGATRRRQQYTGWKALPGGGAVVTGAMTVEQAASCIVTWAGGDTNRIIKDPAEYRDAYRRAAKATHPDTNGEQFQDDFMRLQEAKRVLDKHHHPGAGGYSGGAS